MPRDNSFSDSDGRSLTPDLEDIDGADVLEPTMTTSSPTADPTLSTSPTFDFNATNAGESLQASTTLTLSPATIGNLNGLVYRERTAMYSAPPAVTLPSRSGTMATRKPGAGLARFRSSAHKIIQMRRSSTAMNKFGVGAEPGVDPRRSLAFLTYGHIREKCTIEMVDYSSVRSSFGKMQNKGFVNFLSDPVASKPEPWVKVRWINIAGISWDVMSALAIRYGMFCYPMGNGMCSGIADIHPLALEDVLHRRDQARSKADYYMKHLFIRILRHTLAPENDHDANVPKFTNAPRCASPLDVEDVSDDERGDGLVKGGSEDEALESARRKFSLKRRNTRRTRMRTMSTLLPSGDLEVGPEKPAFPMNKTSSSLLTVSSFGARSENVLKHVFTFSVERSLRMP